VSGDADFSTAAELALSVPESELRSVRDDIESSIGSVPVTVEDGRAGAGVATDGGGIATVAALQEETVDLLGEIEDDLSGGGALGGGGDGGGFDPLSFLAGRGVSGGGGGSGAGTFARLFSASSAATAVASGQLGRGGLQAPGVEREFGGPFGQFRAAFQGAKDIGEAITTPGLGPFGDTAAEDISSADSLPGVLRGIGDAAGGESTDSSSRPNRADERRQQVNPTINVDVTVEQTRQALEQAVRDAKRQAAREVAQEVNQNIPGTTSRTGL
jgi:hypothetical protein